MIDDKETHVVKAHVLMLYSIRLRMTPLTLDIPEMRVSDEERLVFMK